MVWIYITSGIGFYWPIHILMFNWLSGYNLRTRFLTILLNVSAVLQEFPCMHRTLFGDNVNKALMTVSFSQNCIIYSPCSFRVPNLYCLTKSLQASFPFILSKSSTRKFRCSFFICFVIALVCSHHFKKRFLPIFNSSWGILLVWYWCLQGAAFSWVRTTQSEYGMEFVISVLLSFITLIAPPQQYHFIIPAWIKHTMPFRHSDLHFHDFPMNLN